MATSGTDGSCDLSPEGDPPGFTLVLDDRTIALPERAGCGRANLADIGETYAAGLYPSAG